MWVQPVEQDAMEQMQWFLFSPKPVFSCLYSHLSTSHRVKSFSGAVHTFSVKNQKIWQLNFPAIPPRVSTWHPPRCEPDGTWYSHREHSGQARFSSSCSTWVLTSPVSLCCLAMSLSVTQQHWRQPNKNTKARSGLNERAGTCCLLSSTGRAPLCSATTQNHGII